MQASTGESAVVVESDVCIGTEAGWRAVRLCPTYVTECHYCGFQVAHEDGPPPRVCPKCHGSTWVRFPRPGSILGRTANALARGRVRRATSVERGLVSMWRRRDIFAASAFRRPREPTAVPTGSAPTAPAPTDPATNFPA
jgi:hypothetical protein